MLVPDIAPPDRRPSWLPQGFVLAAAVALTVLVLFGGWISLGAPASTVANEPAEDVAVKNVAALGPSIAIIPFENLTDDDRWGRLGRGIASDLTGELARNNWLFVVGPETAARWGGKDLITLGETLDVRFALTGSIQSEASNLRIAARMTDTSAGKVVWAAQWTRPSENIFDLQDEVMERIGGTLASAWTGEIGAADLVRIRRLPTESLSAYEHFLIGAELKQTFAKDGLEAAILHFEKAVEIDPSYARAWAMMSFARNLYRGYVEGHEEILTIQALSHREVEHAYQLDPNDPQVLMRMAAVRGEQNRSHEIEPFLARAIALAPADADILSIAAWIGSVNGEIIGEPIKNAQRAMELNPDHPEWYWISLGNAAIFSKEYDLAFKAFSNAPETLDSKYMMTVLQVYRGYLPQARVLAAELEVMQPGYTIEHRLHCWQEYRSTPTSMCANIPATHPWIERFLLQSLGSDVACETNEFVFAAAKNDTGLGWPPCLDRPPPDCPRLWLHSPVLTVICPTQPQYFVY